MTSIVFLDGFLKDSKRRPNHKNGIGLNSRSGKLAGPRHHPRRNRSFLSITTIQQVINRSGELDPRFARHWQILPKPSHPVDQICRDSKTCILISAGRKAQSQISVFDGRLRGCSSKLAAEGEDRSRLEPPEFVGQLDPPPAHCFYLEQLPEPLSSYRQVEG